MAVIDLFLSRLFKRGQFTFIDHKGRSRTFGSADPSPDFPPVTLRVHDGRVMGEVLRNPALKIGEAYMDGRVTIEQGDIYDLVRLAKANAPYGRSEGMLDGNVAVRAIGAVKHRVDRINMARRSKKNVAHHYDLSDRLYDLFLDRDRQYSCAYFSSGNESLDVAQENKKRHIASKLRLKPGLRILDIGSGWGGLALTLARFSEGAKVTGITLSDEQLKVSRERAAKAGLSNRVDFALRDYRDMRGQFDRIVSVGMFEHVGPNHYGEFFAKVKELLSDDGICLLHSIGRMEPPGGTSPWLRKYIFPGGYTPALSEVLTAVEKVGLWVTDIEILRLHYAKTLREWRRRFLAHRDEALRLYDERFCRMWEFYLTSCEVAFRYLRQMVVQMQLAKHVDTVPLTRDYMLDWEREHANAHGLSAAAQA